MGNIVTIRLKNTSDKNCEKMNVLLKKSGLDFKFGAESDNISWLKDINENPKSPQKHLKPEGEDLTLSKLKEMFPEWTENGILTVDTYFDRTSEDEAKKLCVFITKNYKEIKSIENADDLFELADIKNAVGDYSKDEILYHFKALKSPEKELEMLPEEERTKDDLQSGVMLCKSFSLSPFWVVFGKVESPMFMKNRIYKDDINNSLYRDKKGLGYMLIPLMPLSNDTVNFAYSVYEQAAEMGLREHPLYFVMRVYNMETVDFAKEDFCEKVEEFAKHYTKDELVERFNETYAHFHKFFEVCRINFVYNLSKKMFVVTNRPSNRDDFRNKLSILNILYKAIEKVDKKNYYMPSDARLIKKQTSPSF